MRLLLFLPSKVGVAIPTYSSQMKTSYMTYERRRKNCLNHTPYSEPGDTEARARDFPGTL